jgi:hypothetical protein
MRRRRHKQTGTIDAHQEIHKSTHKYTPQATHYTPYSAGTVTKLIKCDIFKVNFKYNFRMGYNLYQVITFVHKQLITTYTFTVFTHFNRQTALLLVLQLHQYYNIIMHIILTKTCKFCTICIKTNVSLLCPIFLLYVLKEFSFSILKMTR